MPERPASGKKPKAADSAQGVCAALALLDATPWSELTLEAIGKQAKITQTRLQALFPDKEALIPAIGLWVDAQVAAAWQDMAATDMPVKDKLFEILMARFEIMQTHKNAFVRLGTLLRATPQLATPFFKARLGAMRTALTWAGATNTSLAALALLGIYTMVFLRWERDSQREMEATMATLDSFLTRSESLFTHRDPAPKSA